MNKYSYIQHVEGHKNSKGESAPWVIKDHKNGKIISSHKTEEEAKSHLRDMKIHGGFEMEFRNIKSMEEMVKEDQAFKWTTQELQELINEFANGLINKLSVQQDAETIQKIMDYRDDFLKLLGYTI